MAGLYKQLLQCFSEIKEIQTYSMMKINCFIMSSIEFAL